MTDSNAVTTDPICGMAVDKTTALKCEREGTTFYFCGEGCQKQFLSMPNGAKPKRKPGGCCA